MSEEAIQALWIILVGGCVAGSCALVGSFLVLRKMALLGDAISHSVLPGIVLGFLITGSRNSIVMVLGASVVGVLTVLLVELLHKSRRLYEDTSIGVVFPALFSLGVILVSRSAGQVDLDLDCVLYGEISFVGLDPWIVRGLSFGPKALWITGGVFLFDLALVLVLFKELKVTTFDPGLAASLGYSPALLHYMLMSVVSLTVVASFESVGAILVVAMLIVPPATAFLLTPRLGSMITIAVGIGIASSLGGYGFARAIDCSVAGAMAALTGAAFVAAFLLSPREGLLRRFLDRRRLVERLRSQVLLLHLGRMEDMVPSQKVDVEALARRFGWRPARVEALLRKLLDEGLVDLASEGPRLTPDGERLLESTGAEVLAHRG